MAYHDWYGYVRPDGTVDSAATYADYQALPRSYDGVAAYHTPPRGGFFGFSGSPGRIDIFAQATFEGTFEIAVPGGSPRFVTFSGAGFARFNAFHEVGHAIGFRGYAGAELDANRFALRKLGRY